MAGGAGCCEVGASGSETAGGAGSWVKTGGSGSAAEVRVTTCTLVVSMVDTMVVVMTRWPPSPPPLPPPPTVMVTALVVVRVATEVSVAVVTLTWGGAVPVSTGWVRVVVPLMRPLEASSMMLDEMDGTAVTGQTISVRMTVSVTTTVSRASVGKVERSSVLEGQSTTSGRHEVMVRTEVVERVRVVVPASVPLVGNGGALVVMLAGSDEKPVESGGDTGPVESEAMPSMEELVGAMTVVLWGRRRRGKWRGCE